MQAQQGPVQENSRTSYCFRVIIYGPYMCNYTLICKKRYS